MLFKLERFPGWGFFPWIKGHDLMGAEMITGPRGGEMKGSRSYFWGIIVGFGPSRPDGPGQGRWGGRGIWKMGWRYYIFFSFNRGKEFFSFSMVSPRKELGVLKRLCVRVCVLFRRLRRCYHIRS